MSQVLSRRTVLVGSSLFAAAALSACSETTRPALAGAAFPKPPTPAEQPPIVEVASRDKIRRFNRTGRQLSRNDVRVVVLSQLLVEASPGRDSRAVGAMLSSTKAAMDAIIERLWSEQDLPKKPATLTAEVARVPGAQMGLLDRLEAR